MRPVLKEMLSNLERLLFAWMQSLMLGIDDERLVNRLSDIQQNKQFSFIYNVYVFCIFLIVTTRRLLVTPVSWMVFELGIQDGKRVSWKKK